MHSVAAIAIVSLAAAVGAGCGEWEGFGFDEGGPELQRLRDALALRAGMVVADVGAGKGELTLTFAGEVGPGGRVFATELEPRRLALLRETVAAAGFGQITVVAAGTRDTGLPQGCCDAIVLRRVYHHLTDPAHTNASLLRALRPGGLLLVIDLPPPFFSAERSAFGISSKIVVDELTMSGFEAFDVINDWPGRGPRASYCATFRRP